jgi:hypothetical protein
MRIQLPMLIATIAVISSAAAAAAETATSVAPFGPAQASQTAVWTTRTLHNFGGFSDSCDALVEELRVLLLELGARASDLYIDQHGCRREVTLIDATFSVLMPVDKAGKNEAGTLEAGWQILELKTNLERPTMTPVHHIIYRNCAGLEYVTKTVLPLFAARDVKLISKAICDKTGVGLRAEVLTPTRQ